MKGSSLVLIVLTVLIGMPGLMMTGCQKTTSDKDLRFVEPSKAEALRRGRDGVLGLGSSRDGAWVDPRTKAEYDKGHIPGAIHLSYDRVRDEYKQLLEYPLVIVYGNSYNSAVSMSMSKTLRELGVPNVHTMRGGLDGWKAAGGEVVASGD